MTPCSIIFSVIKADEFYSGWGRGAGDLNEGNHILQQMFVNTCNCNIHSLVPLFKGEELTFTDFTFSLKLVNFLK